MLTTKNTIKMAKKKAQDASDDSQEERLVKAGDMVEFTSNGTNKFLGKDGEVHTIHRFHAETLVKKGYGDITADVPVKKPNTGEPIEGLKM